MGYMKRTARFKVYTGDSVPEFEDRVISGFSREQIDRALEEADAEIAEQYGVDPDDIEMYALIPHAVDTPRTDMHTRGPLNKWRRKARF